MMGPNRLYIMYGYNPKDMIKKILGKAEGVIEYLKSKEFNNLAILEGTWVEDRTSLAFKSIWLR